MKRLKDKVALVTGAARGIGAGIARAFAAEGAKVWVTDIDEAGAHEVAAELGDRHRAALLDVGDEAQWIAVIDEVVAAEGRLDILVNNAGITGFEEGTGRHDPEHSSLEEWHRVHRVNLDGTFLGCKHGIRAMRPAKRGAIICRPIGMPSPFRPQKVQWLLAPHQHPRELSAIR